MTVLGFVCDGMIIAGLISALGGNVRVAGAVLVVFGLAGAALQARDEVRARR